VLLPHLNERQQRLALATEARLLGHGGVRAVAEAAGSVRPPCAVGSPSSRPGRIRCQLDEPAVRAGVVKPASSLDPDLVAALLALVEPDERGDPMSPLRWTTKSLRHLAEELTRQGHRSPRPRWAGCCGRTALVCRGPPRRWRASSIQTATRSSATSTSK
jgi:Rhodopirellula transposase DDE domain